MNTNANLHSPLGKFQRPALIAGGVGLILALVGAFLNVQQFWQSYLLAYLFWVEIGLGCLGWLLLHHIVGGRWSERIRPLLETGAMTLPVMGLLFIPLFLGLRSIYPWANADYVAQHELVQQKSVWLNLPFFMARSILYFAVWSTLAWLLNRWSHGQDSASVLRLRRLSAGGMILFVLTSTFAGYDWMMSLEPEWFSSIYGLLFIAGQGMAALAFVIIALSRLVDTNHLSKNWIQSFNDLGNFLLGFVMIWAYFTYSQFLIIWSANLPEEAIWYYHRSQGGWLNVGIVLVAVQFVLPFFLLLSRSLKRNVQWLAALALFIFLARWLDLYWLVEPAFYPEGVHQHWLDLVLLVAIGGGWVAAFIWLANGKRLLVDEPYLGDLHEQHEEFASA